MNYLAHFSTEEDERNGSFSMLVSADDIEIAIEKFKERILESKKNGEIFSFVRKIYLDTIIKINNVPSDAAITRYESRNNDGLGSISTVPVDGKSLEAFFWCPDEKMDELEQESQEVYPFIEF